MTSQRQTDANRRNALLSTGPRTEDGKQQARCNAYRHGLTAETVIVGVEDAAEYEAFESEIVTEYDPKSVIERELTRRLASLLWRLRRASLIETGLLQVESPPPQYKYKGGKRHTRRQPDGRAPTDLRRTSVPTNSFHSQDPDQCHDKNGHVSANETAPGAFEMLPALMHKQGVITGRFLRLVHLNGDLFERVSRYETGLWRQFVQVLYSLDQAKYHRISASRGRFTPHPPQW